MSRPKILVLFYSMYGHVHKLATAEAKGAAAAGAEVKFAQIPETLPAEVLAKMHAAPKSSHPVATLADLEWADGILFGFPTRFGNAPAQVKAFWDSTGQLWQQGKLSGKAAGIFFSTATQGGGQETTALTFLPNLVHHGMIFVSHGYPSPKLFDNSVVHGGSAWGAGTFAGGDGSRQPSDLELEISELQGKNFATTVAALVKGRHP